MASEADVLSALAAYREHIGRANHRAMSVLIPRAESVSADDPDLFESPEKEEETRLDYVLRLVGAPEENAQPPIERPSDALKYWDVLAPQLALDGASRHSDPEWRAAKREVYTSAILQGLSRFECPPEQGPGWRMLRDTTEQLIFWKGQGVDRNLASADSLAERTQNRRRSGRYILEQTYGHKQKYDVAAGFMCGSGNESTSYIVYSRPKGDANQAWSWRYVAFLGQFGIGVFNDVIALLDWYQKYGEPDERDFTADAEVFAP
ncbi:uncharacterized protein F4807DRAFT_469977 [Annulohypoxylon truncatum]|uniref:uncharacterized protein n=1 Tax=Annulohypoxylon truncatum TaxID=327061 RepID=UPI002008C6F5|nr:uncharacterized protein F4807DRAFT_469977 [Annulohypoxylon truncatum]KAI1206763.1 hypothetical protein F4807DRAFT_469977 [Annulohypoxylon truncatum]